MASGWRTAVGLARVSASRLGLPGVNLLSLFNVRNLRADALAAARSRAESFELMFAFVNDCDLFGWQDGVGHLLHSGQLRVEVGEVLADGGLIRGRELLTQKLLHVEVREPLVGQNLLDTLGTKAGFAAFVEQPEDQVLGVGRHLNLVTDGIREVDVRLFDQKVHSMLVTVEEWWDSHNHLVNKDTERPPIDRVVVTISNEHLRGQVLSSSAE
jgi:hypothetical protein